MLTVGPGRGRVSGPPTWEGDSFKVSVCLLTPLPSVSHVQNLPLLAGFIRRVVQPTVEFAYGEGLTASGG